MSKCAEISPHFMTHWKCCFQFAEQRLKRQAGMLARIDFQFISLREKKGLASSSMGVRLATFCFLFALALTKLYMCT
jgi:hypothetical protein